MDQFAAQRVQNLRINLEEYQSGAVELKSFPIVLFLELTQNCNLHCRMCRSSSGYQSDLNMKAELFERLKNELFCFASIVALRGWGESTVLPYLADRVAETAAAGPRIRLVTNALAIRQSLWKLLMDVGACVVVSVDASSPQTMATLGRGSFAKLLNSLEVGARAREESSFIGELNFNTVLSSHNLHELPDIVRLASRYGAKRVNAFPVVASRSNTLHLDNRKADIPKFINEAAIVARERDVELRLGASPHEEYVAADGLSARCSHPWQYCYVDFAGNVGYCDHLIGHSGLTFGNLNELTFAQVWNGPQFRNLRSIHATSRTSHRDIVDSQFPHCGWCYRRRYVDFEDDTVPAACKRVVSTCVTSDLAPLSAPPYSRTDFLVGRKLPSPQPIQEEASS